MTKEQGEVRRQEEIVLENERPSVALLNNALKELQMHQGAALKQKKNTFSNLSVRVYSVYKVAEVRTFFSKKKKTHLHTVAISEGKDKAS